MGISCRGGPMTNTPMPPSRITIQHPTRRAWCRASRASSDQQADLVRFLPDFSAGRSRARSPRLAKPQISKSVMIDRKLIKSNTGGTSIVASRTPKTFASTKHCCAGLEALHSCWDAVSIMGPQHADRANATTCGEPCLP